MSCSCISRQAGRHLRTRKAGSWEKANIDVWASLSQEEQASPAAASSSPSALGLVPLIVTILEPQLIQLLLLHEILPTDAQNEAKT